VPSWIEIVITLAVVFGEIWAFRWVANRMPVFSESPRWVKTLDDEVKQTLPAGAVVQPVKK